MSTNPTAPNRDSGSLCERCRRCAGCHAETGGCPVPNTTCVIGREDCGMPAEAGAEHIDVYPVGLLRDWTSGHYWHRPTRFLRSQIKARNWRAVKNTFNGYLAEPTPWPAGLTRCGSGWTRRRALKSLARQRRRASS